jgi:hypothetical protein
MNISVKILKRFATLYLIFWYPLFCPAGERGGGFCESFVHVDSYSPINDSGPRLFFHCATTVLNRYSVALVCLNENMP